MLKFIQLQEQKKKKKMINELPKVLIKHIATYLDLNSIISMSCVNNKFNSTFTNILKGFRLLKSWGFSIGKEQKIMNMMLERSLRYCKKFFDFTPLHCSVMYQNISIDMVKCMVENKCEINAQNNDGDVYKKYHIKNLKKIIIKYKKK